MHRAAVYIRAREICSRFGAVRRAVGGSSMIGLITTRRLYCRSTSLSSAGIESVIGNATAHPFPALLARAAAGDGEAGAFARDLATKLAERVRTERAVRHTPPADAIGPSKQPPPAAKP